MSRRTKSIVVGIEEVVRNAVGFISDNRFQIYVFDAFENTFFDVGICLFKVSYDFLGFLSFRVILPVVASCAGIGKFASALNEVQIVVISPLFYVIFADEIHRADKFHTLKVGAVQFRHHRLNLCAVKHAHKDCFDDIVVVVSQRDFIAAEL